MYLTEYQRLSIDNFMGLWNRNSFDDIPVDHASDAHNVAFTRKREVITRRAASLGRFTNPGPVMRQFIAEFNNNDPVPIHCDGQGNIWRDDEGGAILSIPGMIDADFLNFGNHLYIAPMVSPGFPLPKIYVWVDPRTTVPVPAAGPPPGVMGVRAISTAGITGPGWYGIAVSFVSATGYVTSPNIDPATVTTQDPAGGWQTLLVGVLPDPNVPGDLGHPGEIIVESLPPLPPGFTSYIIWVTKANQDVPGQPGSGQDLARKDALFQWIEVRPDQFSFPFVIDFFDTQLVIPASNLPGNGNILNNLPVLPGGFGLGGVALQKYHNRMVILATEVTMDEDGTVHTFKDDRVWISNAGAPENFDQVTGYVRVQAEFDGNKTRTGFELFGVFYICKAIGTFSTTDNGSEPNDPTNPWIVNMIDGGIGSWHHGVGTISGSQSALSFNSTAFLANRNGLFLFNGNVLRPELSWKIRGIWDRIGHGSDLEPKIRVAVDIYQDMLYVMLPVPPSDPAYPYILLMADYSLGLDNQNIRWSTINFPFPVFDIMMGYYTGDVTQPDDYFLRLGSDGSIFRLDGSTLADFVTHPIDSYYQPGPAMVGDLGSVNNFRFIRYRGSGAGTLTTLLTDQGGTTPFEPAASVTLLPFPGNFKDQGIQINYMNEKLAFRFGTNGINDHFRIARVDVFAKQRWPTRPNG